MRADLQQLEQIDLYLQGNMSTAEAAAFESRMAADPGLAELVEHQKLVAQAVNRKALLAEIHMVAAGGGGGAWYTNPYLGIAGITVIGGLITATVYFATSEEDMSASPAEVSAITDPTGPELISFREEPETSVPRDTISYTDAAEEELDITERVVSPVVNDEEVEIDWQEEPDNERLVQQVTERDGLVSDDAANSVRDVSTRRVRNKKACFPDGQVAMNEYIDRNMLYPGTAKKEELQANVKVEFLVSREGRKSNVVAECFVLRDKNDKPLSSTQMLLNQRIVRLFEDAAERIIRTMPSWEPATDSQGNPVVSAVAVYFNFSLTDGISVYQLDDKIREENIPDDKTFREK